MSTADSGTSRARHPNYNGMNDELGQTNGQRVSLNGRVSMSGRGSINERQSMNPDPTMAERMTIHAAPESVRVENARSYKGRIRTWPGIILLSIIAIAGITCIIYFSIQSHKDEKDHSNEVQSRLHKARSIKGGAGGSLSDLVDSDGIVGNPKVYPSESCVLPNYVSVKGGLAIVAPNGTSIPISIKGINWFGMETGPAVPFGLWDNGMNGTTAYDIATFLARNKFNSVRLPVCVMSIIQNVKPQSNMINIQTNRAIDVETYLGLLKSIIKSLAYRRISVLISLHTLTPTDRGKLWYSPSIPESNILKAVDILAKNLCNNDYWNVIGLDVKNEPDGATWGSGNEATDFRLGATKIANQMLSGCPNWVAFVEGIFASGGSTATGVTYADWWGGGLQRAKSYPIQLSQESKVVYSPHYYTPAVYPQLYLYGGGSPGGNGVLQGYKELSDQALSANIKSTMDDMFGFLTASDNAVILGEFAGLYAFDKHPMKTTQRCTDFTIQNMIQGNYGGGYAFALNPESGYQYNPADTYGNFVEGVLMPDWLTANEGFLKGLSAMDRLQNLKQFPCIKKGKN